MARKEIITAANTMEITSNHSILTGKGADIIYVRGKFDKLISCQNMAE
ncbi:unnamed protein product, partial [marine sediment metagenome]